MTIINKTMVPLNKYGVPCVDALSYPSRSNSSSIVEGSPGTFYLKKSSQGLYLVEAKINPVPSSWHWEEAWSWKFNQTTNICDPGINVTIQSTATGSLVCPTVPTVNATTYLRYNSEYSLVNGAFFKMAGETDANIRMVCLSNYPTDIEKVSLGFGSSGVTNMFFLFETIDYRRYLVVLTGDPVGMEPSLGWDVLEIYNYSTNTVFPKGTIAWFQFGCVSTPGTSSFSAILFYRKVYD